MNILEKASRILEQPVCDHCLGRQFGQLMHGYSNAERGKMLRTMVAMTIDREKPQTPLDLSNFSGYNFHNAEIKIPKKKKCSVCSDFFDSIDSWTPKISKLIKNMGFSSFLVGTKLSNELVEKEENLWERVGIDFCEPLKSEINREIGKRIEKSFGVKANTKKPDINIIINVAKKSASVIVNPLFIYGEYQKLKRGIPQTKWPSKKYKTSVEEIIAKPFMKATQGRAHKLHGCGREDIDARCLGWRPFVLEIIDARKRSLELNKLVKKIEKSVRVRNLRLSDINEVRKIKESKATKTYRVTVQCERKLKPSDMKKLSKVKGIITQQTPDRVLHRRADKFRRRKVINIKGRIIKNNAFEMTVTTDAGLYVKELISGDSGRTKPSISEVLECKCVPKDLDVMKIHMG